MDVTIEVGFGVSLLVSAEECVYLASPGFADPRLVMRRRDPLLPMAQFDRCVFRFEVPPQVQKRNTLLLHDARSTWQLTYGKAICLVHQHSGLYVTIVKKPAESNPEHHKIALMTQEDAGSACIFRIMPRYKIRSEGDKVCDGDMIYLQQQNSSTSLCTAPQKGIDEPEVTAWEIPSTLQVCLYDGRTEAAVATDDQRHPLIRAGVAALIFHREQDSFLTIPTVNPPSEHHGSPVSKSSKTDFPGGSPSLQQNVPFFKRSDKPLTALTTDAFDFSCNSMWIIEGVDPTVGGAICAGQQFRIRHGATGKYLVVRKPSSPTSAAKTAAAALSASVSASSAAANNSELCLEEIDGLDVVTRSTWEAEIVSAADATGHIYSLKSFLQIKLRATQMYLSTSAVSPDSSAVRMSSYANLADTLTLVMVPRDRQQELSYLIGNVEFLKRYIKLFYKLQEPSCHLSPRDPLVARVVQRATSSLGALIRFCTESDDQDPLTREGLPIAHHQQSMFEVQLHSTAMDVLLCPFVNAQKENKLELPLEGGVLTMEEILDPTYSNIHEVCRLCYRLLKQMSKCSPFAGVLVEYVDFMKAQEGYKLHVADTQMEIFTDNPNIPQAVCEDNIRHFVKLLLTKGRSSGYLRFMSSLCVVGDVGVLANQRLVCNLVLREHAGQVLYTTGFQDGHLCIQVPKGPKGNKKKAAAAVPLEDSATDALVVATESASWERLESFLRTGDAKGVKFFETSIDLLGVLVLGGDELCLTAVRAMVPMDQLMHCITPAFPASDSLRASFFALALHLYIREMLDRIDQKLEDEASKRHCTCGSLVYAGGDAAVTADMASSPPTKPLPSRLTGSDNFLARVKDHALHFIQGCSATTDKTAGINELLLTTTNIWHSVVLYDRHTREEIIAVARAIVATLATGLDAKADGDRYRMSEDTSIVMKTKRGLCIFLQVVLGHETTRISNSILRLLAEKGSDVALQQAEDDIKDLRRNIFDEGRLFPILLDLMFYESKDLVSVAMEVALSLCNIGGVVARRVSIAEPVRTPLATKVFRLFVRVNNDISRNLSPSGNVLNEESLIRAIREISEFDPSNFRSDGGAEAVRTAGARRMSTIAKLQTKVTSMITLNRTLGSVREQRGQWRKSDEQFTEYSRLLFQSGLHRMLLRSLKQTDSSGLRLALLEFFRVLCTSPECATEMCQEIASFVPYVASEDTQSEAAEILLRLVQHSPSQAEALSPETITTIVKLLLKLQEPVIAEGLEHVVLGTYPVARHQELVLSLLLTKDVVQNLLAVNNNWPMSQLAFNSACVDLMACCCVSNSACKSMLARCVRSDDMLRTLTTTVDAGHLVPYLKLLCSGFLSIEEFLTTQDLQMIKRQWADNAMWWNLVDGIMSQHLSSRSSNDDLVFLGILPVLQSYYNDLYMPLGAKSKVGIPASSMAKLLTTYAQSCHSNPECLQEHTTVSLIHALTAIAPHVQQAECAGELNETIVALQKLQSKALSADREVKRARLPGSDMFLTKWTENNAEALQPLIHLLSFGTLLHQQDANVRARRLHEKLVSHIHNRELSEMATIGLMASFRHSALQLNTLESADEFVAAQNYLNSIGCLRMVTEIAISSSDDCGAETMRLAIAILEDGNETVQNNLLYFFANTDERFFHEIGAMIRGCTETTLHHRTRGCHATFYCGVKESKLTFGNLRLVLRFLQLLCEGHHLGMQDYLREQGDNLRSINVPREIERFAAELSLHDLDTDNLELMQQTLAVLTELCQGPCHGNQKLLVSNGVCHLINRVMSSSNFATPQPFTPDKALLLRVKQSSMVLLNALLEGGAEKSLLTVVTQDMPVATLGAVLDAFASTDEFLTDSDEDVCEIVYSCLIAVKTLLQSDAYEGEDKAAVRAIMATHAARFASLGQIEIERNDVIEPVYFRVPSICSILSDESMETLKWSLDRSTQGSKLSDFMDKCDEMIFDTEAMHRVTQQMMHNKAFLLLARWPVRKWDDLSLLMAITINLLFVAIIEDCHGLLDKHVDWLGVEGIIRLCAYTQLLLTAIILFLDCSFNFPLILYKQSKAIKHPTMFQKASAIMQRNETLFRFAAVMFAVMGFMFNDFFFAFHLLGLIARSSELKNVIVAVTQNGKTLLLTGLLGCVVVYLFSIVGFVAFHDHFEHSCDTLSQCVVHILTTGLRQGGGIGDQMTTMKFGEPMYIYRTVFDFFFWAIMIVIFLNILFGIIIDTFAELRDEKNKKEEDMTTRCTICGIDSYTLDRYGRGFRDHTKEEHNMWTYLYFLHHLKKKEPTEYNGQESYVAECVANGDISFFPAGKCSSLKNLPATGTGGGTGDADGESGPSSSAGAGGGTGGGADSSAGIKEAQNLLASSLAANSDQTMTMLLKILAKVETQPTDGGRLVQQNSMRRGGGGGEEGSGGPRSAEVIKLEHVNQNLTRQVFEMERSHAHELEVSAGVHHAVASRNIVAMCECADRFLLHLHLLETIESVTTSTKLDMFANAVSARVHVLQLQAPSSPLYAVGGVNNGSAIGNHRTVSSSSNGDEQPRGIDASRAVAAANGSNSGGSGGDDPLMRDGQEVMKLLRMTIREARAAISSKPSPPASGGGGTPRGAH